MSVRRFSLCRKRDASHIKSGLKETVFFPIRTRKSGRINYKYISCPTISTRKIDTGKDQYRENQYQENQYRENQYRENQTRKSGIYRLLQYTGIHGIHG
jgi:hypothetical protein